MNLKKHKFFVNVVANFVIMLILAIFCGLTLNVNSQQVFSTNKNDAIYNGNRASNKVSLMINVYWGSEYILEMLDVLKSFDVKTTFFVGGQWVEKQPNLLKSIFDAGHEIGNHGYFHRDHSKLNYDQNREEIGVCETMVNNFIGIKMNLFAPPSGSYGKTTLEVAKTLGYKTIMWSKDTIDWRDKDDNVVLTRATKNVVGGDLILMHPTAHTLKALPKILEYYKTHNLNAVTVSENLK